MFSRVRARRIGTAFVRWNGGLRCEKGCPLWSLRRAPFVGHDGDAAARRGASRPPRTRPADQGGRRRRRHSATFDVCPSTGGGRERRRANRIGGDGTINRGRLSRRAAAAAECMQPTPPRAKPPRRPRRARPIACTTSRQCPHRDTSPTRPNRTGTPPQTREVSLTRNGACVRRVRALRPTWACDSTRGDRQR